VSRSRATFVVLALLVAHISLFAHIRPFGVAPNVLLLAAVIGGSIGGGDFGARHGFACGLLFDLMVPAAPFGLAAGLYGAIGYGAGLFAQSVDSHDPRVVPATAGLGCFAGVLGYGLGLGVLGVEQYVEWRLLWVALAVAVYGVLLAFPVRALYGWVAAAERSYVSTRAPRSMVK